MFRSKSLQQPVGTLTSMSRPTSGNFIYVNLKVGVLWRVIIEDTWEKFVLCRSSSFKYAYPTRQLLAELKLMRLSLYLVAEQVIQEFSHEETELIFCEKGSWFNATSGKSGWKHSYLKFAILMHDHCQLWIRAQMLVTHFVCVSRSLVTACFFRHRMCKCYDVLTSRNNNKNMQKLLGRFMFGHKTEILMNTFCEWQVVTNPLRFVRC